MLIQATVHSGGFHFRDLFRGFLLYCKRMKHFSYEKTALLLSGAGTLFAGYLSGVKLFSRTCAFGESCPYFLGYPSCYYGLFMYLVMFSVSLCAFLKKTKEPWPAQANAFVSFLGILFAGYFVWLELSLLLSGHPTVYALGLPTCAYGLIFYVAIFCLSVRKLRKNR